MLAVPPVGTSSLEEQVCHCSGDRRDSHWTEAQPCCCRGLSSGPEDERKHSCDDERLDDQLLGGGHGFGG